jgi:hypothetical protein
MGFVGGEDVNVLIGNGQRRECDSVVDCKLRKNVVQVNFDRSCGEIEPAPHLFIWQSRGYQLSNLAFAFCKHRERFLGGVRRGAGFSGPGRPYGQSPSGRDLPQVADQDVGQYISGNYSISPIGDSENRLQFRRCSEEDDPSLGSF